MNAKLLKINETANVYAVKHSHLPSHFRRISVTVSLPSAYPMRAEEGVEVGAADVDFATYLGEGDEALVAVVLPRLGGDAEDFADFVGLKPVFAGASNLVFLDYLNETVEFLVQ